MFRVPAPKPLMLMMMDSPLRLSCHKVTEEAGHTITAHGPNPETFEAV